MLNRMGWEVHRYRPSSDPRAQLYSLLTNDRLNVVLDIGANVGQYGTELRELGYSGRIVSVEPLASAHAKLSERALHDDKWLVAPRCAIGATEGEVRINIAGNSVSSSVLSMNTVHSDAAPGSSYVGSELTPLMSLDRACAQFIGPSDRVFLKVDTQGYEWAVLDGATDTLKQVHALSIEASLVELYERQHLWANVVERLTSSGWKVWDIQPAFSDPRSGQLLQVDLLFVRADLPVVKSKQGFPQT